MLKALFTSTSYYPSIGGAQLHWYMVNRMMVQAGHDVQVFSQWRDNRDKWLLDSTVLAPSLNERYDVEGIQVHNRAPNTWQRLSMVPFLPTYYALPEISVPVISTVFQKFLRPIANGADLVHNIRIGRENLSWASYRIAREKGIPFFITPNYSPRMQTKLGKFTLRNFFKLLRLSDGVFVFTDEEKEEMKRIGVPEENVCVIGIGPLLSDTWNAEKFKKDYQINGPMVLFLGQKLPYKGFDALLEASRIIWEKHPDTHFVFIGPHYQKSKEMLSNINDKRIVDISGIKPFDDLKASALAAASIFTLPSRQEGIGGVYIEAWSMSKPVIACNIPFVREVIDDGVDGFLIEQNPAILAEKIIWLLDHPETAAKMGAAGKQKVDEKYNWVKIVEKIEAFYHSKIDQAGNSK